MEVVILVISYECGEDVYACDTTDTAYCELFKYVKSYWIEQYGDIPEDVHDAIDTYFDECPNEWYLIKEVEIITGGLNERQDCGEMESMK